MKRILCLEDKRGMALIIAISIMAILSALAASFSYQMRMEEEASFNYLGEVKASSIAQAGVNLAISALEKDLEDNKYDGPGDEWLDEIYQAEDWEDVKDDNGNLVGAYKIKIEDEAGKINLNIAGDRQNEGWTTFEISLVDFLTALGIPSPDTVANNLIYYREGPGPGEENYDDDRDNVLLENDGIDNDGDDSIDEPGEGFDEPDELVVWSPYPPSAGEVNSDTPFLSLDEVKKAVGEDIFSQIQPYITLYSFDLDMDDSGLNRINLNLAEPVVVDTVLVQEGIHPDTALQLSANIADYRDRNHYATHFINPDTGEDIYGVEDVQINEVMPRTWGKFRGVRASIYDNGWGPPMGEIYSNNTGDSANWTWGNINNGKYYLRIYCHPSGLGEVNVTVNGNFLGSFTPSSTPPYAIDLEDKGNVDITTGQLSLTLQDVNDGIPASFFFIILSQQSQYIELLNLSEEDIDLSLWTVEVVGESGPVSRGIIPLGTTFPARSYLLLVDRKDNSSPERRDNDQTSFESGWGDNTGLWGDTPKEDTPLVSLEWGGVGDHALDFSSNRWDSVSPPQDATDKGDTVIVRDEEGRVVCRAWFFPKESDAGDSVILFTALEKKDPTLPDPVENWRNRLLSGVEDEDRGIQPQGTPGQQNTGVNSVDLDKIIVKNRPFASVGELYKVKGAIGKNDSWKRIEEVLTDETDPSQKDLLLVRIADRFTVTCQRLEAEYSSYYDNGWGDSYPASPPFLTDYYYTNSESAGTWGWGFSERISPDTALYSLYILGKEDVPLLVKVDTWVKDYPEILVNPGPDGMGYYGEVWIADPNESREEGEVYLQITVRKPPGASDAYFDGVVLAPLPRVYGRININTADKVVLEALPNVDSSLAQYIRNYIDTQGPLDSTGKLLYVLENYWGDLSKACQTFSHLSNLVTVRSNLFRIKVTGRSVRDTDGDGKYDEGADEILGEYRIDCVYER